MKPVATLCNGAAPQGHRACGGPSMARSCSCPDSWGGLRRAACRPFPGMFLPAPVGPVASRSGFPGQEGWSRWLRQQAAPAPRASPPELRRGRAGKGGRHPGRVFCPGPGSQDARFAGEALEAIAGGPWAAVRAPAPPSALGDASALGQQVPPRRCPAGAQQRCSKEGGAFPPSLLLGASTHAVFHADARASGAPTRS